MQLDHVGIAVPSLDEALPLWRAAGARALNTASAGTVSFVVDRGSGVSPPRCHRVHARRFWWHVGGSADACHPVSSGHPTEPVGDEFADQRRDARQDHEQE